MVHQAEKSAGAWERLPQRTQRIALAAAAGLVLLFLFFLIWRYVLGDPELRRARGRHSNASAGYSLILPPRAWYAAMASDPGSAAAFYRGRRRSAPVVLRIYHQKTRAPLPQIFDQSSADLLRPYFTQRAERIFVNDGAGFDPGKPAVLRGLGIRDGIWLDGKARPTLGNPYPVHLIFTYKDNDEYILVFTVPGKNPKQYLKEIRGIAQSFRVE